MAVDREEDRGEAVGFSIYIAGEVCWGLDCDGCFILLSTYGMLYTITPWLWKPSSDFISSSQTKLMTTADGAALYSCGYTSCLS